MQKTRQLLHDLGIHTTILGFHYLDYGLTLCQQNERYLLSVYTCLYADIARHYDVSPGSVEHCIRTAVATCWNAGNRQLLLKLAGYELSGRPTSSEFIAILYEYLSMH